MDERFKIFVRGDKTIAIGLRTDKGEYRGTLIGDIGKCYGHRVRIDDSGRLYIASCGKHIGLDLV